MSNAQEDYTREKLDYTSTISRTGLLVSGEEGPYAETFSSRDQSGVGLRSPSQRREVGNCRCPKRFFVRLLSDGAKLFGGCERADCVTCREYKLTKLLKKIERQVVADMGTGTLYLMGGVTRRESKPGELPISEKKMTALATAAFNLAQRPRPKARAGRPAWPGVRMQRFRGPGINKSGVGHEHYLVKVKAREPAPMPPVTSIQQEINFNLSRSVKRVVCQAGVTDQEISDKLVNVYLEHCEDTSDVARYLLFAQGAEPGQTVPAEKRRVSYSRGFFDNKQRN